MRGTIVFDLDGTLAETAPDIMATLNRILEREGLPALPVSRARELVGAGARALIDRGFRVSGAPLTPERLEALFQDFMADYLAHVHVESHLFPGVEAALDALLAEGYALAVCTNKPEPHSVKLIKALGIADRFRFIAGRETFAVCKPEPLHLIETIRAAGGASKPAIMVGDSKTDLDTARAARIPVIGVPFGYTPVPMADLGPDRLIAHFDELSAAVAALMPH